jgi:hypothetical protein
VPHLLPVGRSRPEVSAWAEVLGDRPIRGEEALGVTRRLKALHPSFPLPRGLMGVLGAVIQIAMPAVLDAGQELS